MSGHSKWANIRVRKGAQDAQRGKVFTRHARLIEMAARSGGGDPVTNAGLRTAIDSAKEDSVPNANIERAIKKGLGELKGEAMQEIIYEAYGPGGTAYVIECLSDNRNRSAANVRMAITKHGGRMADGGSVAWMFERKGTVTAEFDPAAFPPAKLEELELELIDFGAEDFSAGEGTLRVTTSMTEWTKLRDFLKAQGCKILSAGLSFVPKQRVPVDEATAGQVMAFMEAIEEDDDVSEVHTNAEI
jgi:YebC/PmpR family DNA-binding regulatory protein